MMSKKTVKIISSVVAVLLVLIMVFGMVSSAMVAFAANSEELKTQLSDLQGQKAEAKKQIAELEKQKLDAEVTRAALEKQINITRKEIAVVEKCIADLQDQIDVKQVELAIAQEQLADKEEKYALAVRDMYEMGDTGYLEVLMNATSFTMMLSRIETVNRVSEYHQSVVTEFTAAREDIATKKDELEKTQQEQKTYQDNLEYQAEELKQSEAEQKALVEDLEYYQQLKKEEFERLEGEMASVSNEIAAMSRASAASGSDSDVVYYYDGTELVWPTPSCTSNSSAYGYRVHPIYGTRKFHAGEDIPASSGAQILAAASGTVVTAGWVSGYGNYTVIDHGGGMMTAYGHQSGFAVSVGDYVNAGDTIGYVGSTGNSTGPHLHFEIYVNGSTRDPKGYSYVYL